MYNIYCVWNRRPRYDRSLLQTLCCTEDYVDCLAVVRLHPSFSQPSSHYIFDGLRRTSFESSVGRGSVAARSFRVSVCQVIILKIRRLTCARRVHRFVRIDALWRSSTIADDDQSGARNAVLLTPQTLVLAAAVSRRGRDELQTVHMSSILSISCCGFQSILGEPLVWLA